MDTTAAATTGAVPAESAATRRRGRLRPQEGDELAGVMDAEGRVDESRLRSYILKNGGVSPAERPWVWRFLFGIFPCSATTLQQPLLAEELAVRYGAMKRKWQRLLPGTMRIRLNGSDDELTAAVRFFEQRREREKERERQEAVSPETRERLSFLELQAQVLLERVSLDLDQLTEAIRIIDKDVPRTERDLDYFQGEGSANLLVLREILITFAAFHPEVSYAQGMSDLCSRFLEVLDSEAEAFWCFCSHMERAARDFSSEGLRRKIEMEAGLLKELDPELHSHLLTDATDTLAFCHRWLLLGFQREFDHSDALRLFEVLSCDHLELLTPALDRALCHQRLTTDHSTEEAGPPPLEPRPFNPDLTFELFVCAAILMQHREALLRCRGEVQLIQFTSSLQGRLDLDTVLLSATQHFLNYCSNLLRRGWGYPQAPPCNPPLLQLRGLFS